MPPEAVLFAQLYFVAFLKEALVLASHSAPQHPVLLQERNMSHFRPIVARPAIPLDRILAAPNTRVAKQQRHRHTEKEWEDKKPTITQLYINEGKSAEAVIEILQHDFTIW